MACNRMKRADIRSMQTAYNNDSQPITAAEPTQLTLLGNIVCDTGCAIETIGRGFRILADGVYRLSFDVTVNSTAAGISLATVQMMMGGEALPCAISREGIAQNAPTTLHAETQLEIGACRIVKPVVSIWASGIDGTVEHVCASAVKMA